MQISSVSPNFTSRRDNVDAFIALDDASIRQMAYLKTQGKIDHNHNRKVTNALFYSAPLAAGLGTALLTNSGNTKLFSTELTGTAGRMAKGLKVAALWTAGLLAIDALGALKNKIAQNSPEVRKFDREHPILSIGTLLAAGIGALALVSKGAVKLGEFKAPQFLQNASKKVGNFLNESRIMVAAKDGYKNLMAKTPSSLKEIGATVLDWAPTALLFGGLFHSVRCAGAENREFAKNYTELRDKQASMAHARVQELSMQNDLLMQEPENRENMKVLADNLVDLPEEVVEKVETLRAEREAEEA